jgi:hypothetical protein
MSDKTKQNKWILLPVGIIILIILSDPLHISEDAMQPLSASVKNDIFMR